MCLSFTRTFFRLLGHNQTNVLMLLMGHYLSIAPFIVIPLSSVALVQCTYDISWLDFDINSRFAHILASF